eukprot:5119984-Pleurochrysis_carterae.AAC.2
MAGPTAAEPHMEDSERPCSHSRESAIGVARENGVQGGWSGDDVKRIDSGDDAAQRPRHSRTARSIGWNLQGSASRCVGRARCAGRSPERPLQFGPA